MGPSQGTSPKASALSENRRALDRKTILPWILKGRVMNQAEL